MNIARLSLKFAIVIILWFTFGNVVMVSRAEPISSALANAMDGYPGVPKSSFYEVTVTEGSLSHPLAVFQSTCPEYQLGYQNELPKDQYPFKLFQGRNISWANFSFSNQVTIQVRVLNPAGTALEGRVKIYPSRFGITPTLSSNLIRFTLTQPGQFSVEIGDHGYQHGLVIFANPPETDAPSPADAHYYIVRHGTPAEIHAVPTTYSGIYFQAGVHDLGVYHVPAHIHNIYFAPGSWVYGAIIMDGLPGVKIFGRGVLSEAKLNYRESHVIEALNHSDRIDLEGIVLADTKFFAVRLLGTNNIVQWIKIVGGWTYNTDGIAAFGGSTVAHCFIWANDDSIKPYADNLNISDCVVWQLNNGGVIQLSWGNAKATNVVIRNVDVLHTEWNNDAANHGILSCIGDKFAKGGVSSWQKSFLIENLTTETPVPIIFNVRPNPASPDQIHGMIFKHWNVKWDASRDFPNYLEGSDPTNPFDGFVFDHFTVNGVALTSSNWIQTGRFVTKNLAAPAF